MYNNFYPFQNPAQGFQPSYYPTPQFQQQQGSQFQQTTNTNKIFVNGIEDVKNRMLPVNSDFIFLDNDKDLMYRKVTDGTGKTTVYTYKISQIENDSSHQTQNPDYSKFALKEDLENMRKELDSYKKAVYELPSVQNIITKPKVE